MTVVFAPLLAATFNNKKFPPTYPVLGSPKFDGIRCIIIDGIPMTRSLKHPVKNDLIRTSLTGLPGFDGELMYGDPWDEEACSKAQSLVMSKSKPELEHDWRYYIFDNASPELKNEPFKLRFDSLVTTRDAILQVRPELESHLCIVAHSIINDEAHLYEMEDQLVKAGYEGLMIRSFDGFYKYGRSTAKEGILQKIKRWEDAEGIILEVYEEEENTNEATVNALGKTERSSHKANKVGKNTLGGYKILTYRLDALNQFSLFNSYDIAEKAGGVQIEFDCAASANMTAERRKELWEIRNTLIGKTITFKYQPTLGAEKPRFPSFKCFREAE